MGTRCGLDCCRAPCFGMGDPDLPMAHQSCLRWHLYDVARRWEDDDGQAESALVMMMAMAMANPIHDHFRAVSYASCSQLCN